MPIMVLAACFADLLFPCGTVSDSVAGPGIEAPSFWIGELSAFHGTTALRWITYRPTASAQPHRTRCLWKNPSIAAARGCGRTRARLGNARKHGGVSGLPIAASKRPRTISTAC